MYVLVIDCFLSRIVNNVDALRKRSEFADLGILLLTTQPDKYQRFIKEAGNIPFQIISCDFQNEDSIKKALQPFIDQLNAVVCYGDKRIQYLRRVIPFLPPHIRVSSVESLILATNKQLMRDAFLKKHPEISPKYTEVQDDSPKTIESIETNLKYPVIVKPANLVSSLLIQACWNRQELTKALSTIYKRIGHIYDREERRDRPQVIAEEYLEGDFYSIDTYSLDEGQIWFCPPVGYIPAKLLGIDDFFIYKRFMPTELSIDQIKTANETVKKALNAVNLIYSSAHVELIFGKYGWKIIEIGPRIGRFRHAMYGLSYGIDHGLNDIKIHLGIKPEIPTKFRDYVATYSIYPTKEGVLKNIKGLNSLKDYSEIKRLKVFTEAGILVNYAKHGGHALAEIIVASNQQTRYAKVVDLIEKKVHAEID